MLNIIWNFIQVHPVISVIIFIVFLIIIMAILERIIYEHIPCHIIENGRRRNSPVIRHRSKNTYKIHGLNGKWKDLSSDQIKLIEEKRKKFDKHGKHIHPVLHV